MTSDEKHTLSINKIGGYIVTIVITILFLYLALRNVDLNLSFTLISKISFLWLLVYLIVFFLSHLFRALRWKVIIKPVKSDSSTLNLFGALMVGYGVNCVIPRLGELYRGLFLGKWEGISRSTMIGTIVVERVIDISSFALASLISVYIYSGDLFNEIAWLKLSLTIGFFIVLILILFIILFVKFEQKFISVILKFTDRISPKLSEKISGIFSTLIEGFSSIKGTRNVLNITLYTILIFLFYALNTYIGFYMLGMDKINILSFGMAWVFMAISAYGVFIPTPGGTGSYHMISIFVLSELYNFSTEVSAAYAILSHFIQYFAFIGSAILLIFVINKKRQKEGANTENFFSVFNAK